jgi:hypothetical protein
MTTRTPPEFDTHTIRRAAVAFDVDPRSIRRELEVPGSVRGAAGHRARAAVTALRTGRLVVVDGERQPTPNDSLPKCSGNEGGSASRSEAEAGHEFVLGIVRKIARQAS